MSENSHYARYKIAARLIKEFQKNAVVLNGNDSSRVLTGRAEDKSDDTVLDSWME